MIVVIPFHPGDSHLVGDLLEWCYDLGGCPNHNAILVADAAVKWDVARTYLREAQSIFKSASILATDQPYTDPWPMSANAMWFFAARHVKEPWLWLEPDAIPLRTGWLDAISDAYARCNRPFMGAIVPSMLNGQSFTYMNGVAVYPANVIDIVEPAMRDARVAWDVAAAPVILSKAMNTSLIHCWWGEKDLPPTFSPGATGRNAKKLDWIPKDAVLHHRCKDGSLIMALRQKFGLPRNSSNSRIIVALPVCNKDIDCMIGTLEWMLKLHGRLSYRAVLPYPSDMGEKIISKIRQLASAIFSNVELLRYRGSSTAAWPSGANLAWQVTASRMLQDDASWLWLEPDAIPLKPDWLDQLVLEYERCGNSFMGPIVPQRGHMNGVGIYPADAALRCPKAMKATRDAWDTVMREEMIHDCHDSGNLIFHFWGVVKDKPHPCEGDPPYFETWRDVQRWIPKRAVLMHRNKDGSLVKRLTENHENKFADSVVAARPVLA